MILAEAKEIAFQAYQVGDFFKSVEVCQHILWQQPNDTGTLHLLGVIYYQTGRIGEAIAYYQITINTDPSYFEAHNNLGVALADLGRIDEAIVYYQCAIAINPDYVQAYYNLSNAYQAKGQLDVAIQMLQKTIELQPDHTAAHNKLGILLQQMGQPQAAMAQFQQAIALQPTQAMAHQNLGNVLQEQGLFEEAIAHYQQAATLQPDNPRIHYNLGNALREIGALEDAHTSYQRALLLMPDFWEAHTNLGLCLSEQNQPEMARLHLQEAIRLNPQALPAHALLGDLWLEQGQLQRALGCFESVLQFDPHYAHARCHRGFIWLLRGELERGFPEYTQHLLPFISKSAMQTVWQQPQWDGTPLDGQRILIHWESSTGFGDAIQYIRYLPLIRERGGKPIVICPVELMRLFSTVASIEELVPLGFPLPDFQVHAPLIFLPWLLQTTLESIPADVPYLAPPTPAVPPPKVPAYSKIGIVWAGLPRYRSRYRDRSCPLIALLPLLELPNLAFYSLQKGPRAADLAQVAAAAPIHDLSDQLHDFADTAAIINQLDLVISVDTAVAHLAGALAKPVWVMLPVAADCRWLLQREDSPWYPTMRLFRQTQPGDWAGVVVHIRQALLDMSHDMIG